MPCMDRTSPKLAFNDATDLQRKSRQSFSALDLSCCDTWCTCRSSFNFSAEVLFQLSNFRMSAFVRNLRCRASSMLDSARKFTLRKESACF